jgi:hypothetical protein
MLLFLRYCSSPLLDVIMQKCLGFSSGGYIAGYVMYTYHLIICVLFNNFRKYSEFALKMVLKADNEIIYKVFPTSKNISFTTVYF